MKNIHRIILTILLVIIYCVVAHTELIPINNGLGWDGKHYANLTINFEQMALHKEIDSYQYQRIVTPAIIFYGCKILNISLTADSIASIYTYYNLILILLSSFLFFKIGRILKFSAAIEIIGFSALFFNYFILKNTPYYPVLTDPTAFFMGVLIIYFYIQNNTMGLIAINCIGLVVFPLFSLATLPLCLNIKSTTIFEFIKRNSRIIFWIMASVYSIAIALVCIFPDKIILAKYLMASILWVLPIGALCTLLFWFVIYKNLMQLPLAIGNTASSKFPYYSLLIMLLFILALPKLITQISIPEEVFTPTVFLFNIIQQSANKPFVSLISHVIYFGPALLLIVYFGKKILATIILLGDSAIIYFLGMIVLMIGSESRQFIYYWPFLVLVLLITLSKLNITIIQSVIFVLVSVLFSKCWFPINVSGAFANYDYSSFPEQRYFMNHGPYVSYSSYFINIGAIVVTVVFLLLIFYNKGRVKNATIDSPS